MKPIQRTPEVGNRYILLMMLCGHFDLTIPALKVALVTSVPCGIKDLVCPLASLSWIYITCKFKKKNSNIGTVEKTPLLKISYSNFGYFCYCVFFKIDLESAAVWLSPHSFLCPKATQDKFNSHLSLRDI